MYPQRTKMRRKIFNFAKNCNNTLLCNFSIRSHTFCPSFKLGVFSDKQNKSILLSQLRKPKRLSE